MLNLSDYLFYILAFLSCISGVGVVVAENPIYSALFLAGTMISIAGLFVTLGAAFIAGVQLIVYAGAVMVLFVMVLMLFDLKHEMKAFSQGMVSGFFKLLSVGVILGSIVGSIYMSQEVFSSSANLSAEKVDVTKALATTLYTKYIFGFELIGALLLIIAIGAVTLSRIQGGTHAND